MTEKELVENALQTAIPEVIESLKSQLIASLDNDIERAAKEQIIGYVTEWMGENLIPVIGSRLMNIKETFEAQADEFCKKMADKIFESMLRGLDEKLERSWDRAALFKSLF